jgi:predicted TIM-barrel fold metal-dependent hydrolase
MIDMHAHWRPVALMDALRKREREPRIVRNAQGVEVLKTRAGEETLEKAFDDVNFHLAKMERQGVTTSVLSLLGSFCWVEARPLDEAISLCRLYNDSVSKLCQENEGKFLAYAATPLRDIKAAAAELERAMSLPGMVGAQLPADAFATYKDAEKMRPILEVAHRRQAILFIHYGGLPDQPFPHLPNDVDNARRRNGTLDMQANLSAAMMTLCMTDILDAYPDAKIHVHNLGGNIPYEMERMDHRCLLDTPEEELPSARFRRAKVFVDCNSFGPHAIEAGVRAYGAERIICGTDGTEFGCEWTNKAVRDADIGEEARQKILHRNAERMLSHSAPLAQREKAAA